MAKKTARAVAADALTGWQAGGIWSAKKLNEAIGQNELDSRDTALCIYLCNGVIQNAYLLDYHISAHSKIRINKLENRVHALLRLGAFQLLFAESIPKSAAVNETVALCRAKNERSSGYVNAVLRGIAQISDPYFVDAGDDMERISIRYSHPRWICDEIYDILGDGSERAIAENNSAPPVTIQVNTLRCTAEELAGMLEESGISVVRHGFLRDALELRGTGNISRLPAYRQGLFWVQDTASMLSVKALAPKAGDKILDICAAPGGKSFAAAVLSGGKAEVVSCDISEKKLALVRHGAKRMKLKIKTALNDAKEFNPEFEAYFDKVICDVPCSGLGIIRKKPDIRYKDRESVLSLPGLQLEILETAKRYLKAGGELVYSTCTWRDAENRETVEKFIKNNPEFCTRVINISTKIEHKAENMVTLWPHLDGTDGFFICHMRKNDV
ncbi:MAG: 16S rRNA (cytosine(967)-C(5))-methyltransferase RsmB [Oscillospiraceae bacterium]|jgi:16S rRNA (cytosine967-C5)-methyltransferase|nr:16S rRNA (cytosine(967)-C(5))-methyltransferase RsmB [Oscillospiraceae bacterium]